MQAAFERAVTRLFARLGVPGTYRLTDGREIATRFISKQELPFTLLTDAEPCPVAASYDSYGLKKFMGREYMGMMRHTFVIDPEGRLERIYTKVKAETMADDILADLALA